MTNLINHDLLDLSLQNVIDNAVEIHLCTADPANYADIASKTLAHKTFTAGTAFASIVNGDTNGRKIMSTAITDGSITGDGTVTKWAVASGTKLLLNGTLSASLAVTSGNTFSLESFRFELPDH